MWKATEFLLGFQVMYKLNRKPFNSRYTTKAGDPKRCFGEKNIRAIRVIRGQNILVYPKRFSPKAIR